LYAICDRVAVLADKKVLITAPIGEVEKFDHPWVQEYFHGPRARAAQKTVGKRDETKSPHKLSDKDANETPDEPRNASVKQAEQPQHPPAKGTD
nr:hypothetical protein [Pseudomonadota bacterium]